MRMLLAIGLAKDRENLSIQGFRAREVSAAPQHVGEIAHADPRVGIQLPQDFASDGQRFLQERFGFLVGIEVAIHAAELRERVRHVRMLGAEHSSPNGERLLEDGRRGGGFALSSQDDAELLQALGKNALVLRARGAAPRRHALLQERHRLVVEAEPPIDPSDDGEHLGLEIGLIRQLLFDPRGAGIEELAHGRFLSLASLEGVRSAQQVRQQLADLGRLLGLEAGAVAFLRQP
jgi:hypothetical protein